MSFATATSTEGKGGLPARPAAGSYSPGMTEMQMALTYSQKLKDPRWQRKRLEVMQRDEFRCRVCYDDSSTLHVHHKHYISGRQPWEYELHELVTVCEGCHEEAHKIADELKLVSAHFEMDGPWSIKMLTALAAGYRDRMYATRGEGAVLEAMFNDTPEGYALGEIAAELFEPSDGNWRGHFARTAALAEIVKARGSIWVYETLEKANSTIEAGAND